MIFKGLKILLFTFICLFGSVEVCANHIVGGDLQLLSRGNDRYLVRLNLLFDNVNGGLEAIDPQALIGIFSKATNQLRLSITIPYRSGRILEYSNPDCRAPNYSITRHFYELELPLPLGQFNEPGGYYMVYERCCRNSIANNVLNPANTGMVFYLEFPSLSTYRNNSSPEWPPWKSDYLCLGVPYQVDLKAIDANGDSLSYEFIQPLWGNTSQSTGPVLPVPLAAPYQPIVWAGGLSATNPFASSPQATLSTSGILRVTPSQQGVYLFSVRVSEFRAGIKIGEARRDFQYQVRTCPQAFSPQAWLGKPGLSIMYNKQDTVTLRDADDRCLQLRVSDRSQPEVVQLRASLLPIWTGSVQLDKTSARINGVMDTADFRICLPDCGTALANPQTLHLIYQDGTCPLARVDTFSVFLKSQPSPNSPPQLKLNPATDTLLAPIGSPISLEVEGLDTLDQDSLYLDLRAEGFTLAIWQSNWKLLRGKSQLRTELDFASSCSKNRKQPYPFVLTLFDGSCYASNAVSRRFWIKTETPKTVSSSFEVPNLITPNGDGINDLFRVEATAGDPCQSAVLGLRITDRWGRKLMDKEGPDLVWDPSGLPSGIYFALISYEQKEYFTTINVIR
jgi:gliding motility-associated-like protein